MTVTSVNDKPTANSDAKTVAEDSGAAVIDVLTNDSSAPDTGETLTVTAVTQPAAGGSVTLTGGVVRFTPNANYYGTTSFTYTISDGNGGTATASVTVTVTSVNDPPTANADAKTVAEDSGATIISVLANDSFAPDTGETLTVASVTQGTTGTVTLAGGVVRYTPGANFSGTDTFTYTVSDGNGGTATATVTVTVTPVNDPPTANNDAVTMAEDSAATVIDVLANDSPAPDTGETLTVIAVAQGTNGGRVTLTGGVVRYAPALNFSGTDTFTYIISDGNAGTAVATVTVTVTPVNDPPTANNDAKTVAEDSGTTVIDVLANDTTAPDTGEVAAVLSITQGAHGVVSLTDGVVRYAPDANFSGSDAFTYTITDGNGGTATATVGVTVTPVNDNPVADGDTATVAEDSGAAVIDVLANDTAAPDAGETLTVTAVTQPAAGGSVTLTGGVVRFTPTANYYGTTSFTYTISDGNGGTATATVAVTVAPVNDPPTANPDAVTVAEDSGAAVIDVLANDTAAPDTGETLTVTAVTQPAHGTVTLVSGVIRFTPRFNFFGTHTFTYTVSDGNGGTAVGTVAVTVPAPPTLAVTGMTAGGSVLAVGFGKAFDPSRLNVGATAARGPADVTLTGPGGALVRGTVVPAPDRRSFAFVPTGGPLAAGTYTLRLRSAATGFAGPDGELLDGDADGTPGGDYVTTVTVAEPGSLVAPPLVGVPDVARGPGQAVNVPAGGAGLPIRVTPGVTPVTDLTVDFTYDPALLSVTGATAGPGAANDATVTVDLSTPGIARLTYRAATGVTGATARDLIALTAAVPTGATPGGKAVLGLASLTVNGGAGATADAGVLIAAYLGDANGTGSYSGLDASLVARVAAGLDGGLAAYPLADPAVVADVTGDGRVTGLDASLIARRAARLPNPLPALPAGAAPVPAGSDPVLAVVSASAAAGGVVAVAVTVSVPEAEPGAAVQGVNIALAFDPGVVEVVGVRAGADLAAAGFRVESWVDAVSGTVRVSAYTSGGGVYLPAGGLAEALVLDVRIRPDAPAGAVAALNLVPSAGAFFTGAEWAGGWLPTSRPPTDRADDPVDGRVTVLPPAPAADPLDDDGLSVLGGVRIGME